MGEEWVSLRGGERGGFACACDLIVAAGWALFRRRFFLRLPFGLDQFVALKAASLAVRRNLRAGAAVLRTELSGISADSGDLIAVTDSSVALRAARGFGVVCAAPSGSQVVLDDSLLSRPLDDPEIERPRKKLWKDGQQVETHNQVSGFRFQVPGSRDRS